MRRKQAGPDYISIIASVDDASTFPSKYRDMTKRMKAKRNMMNFLFAGKTDNDNIGQV